MTVTQSLSRPVINKHQQTQHAKKTWCILISLSLIH